MTKRSREGKAMDIDEDGRIPDNGQRFGPWVEKIPGENPAHLPGHNFTGPGTFARKRIAMGIKPTNAVDEASMHHDLDYGAIQKEINTRPPRITKSDAAKLVARADAKLLERCKNLIGTPLEPNDGSAQMVMSAMMAKLFSDKNGWTDPLQFIKIKDSSRPVKVKK